MKGRRPPAGIRLDRPDFLTVSGSVSKAIARGKAATRPLPENRQQDAERAQEFMAIESVRCPVLGAHVTRVTDLEGEPVRIICPEYDEPTGICRLKKGAREGGPLSQLLERVSEEALDTKNIRCDLGAH